MSTANTLPPLVLLLVLSLTGGLQAQTSSIPRDASLYIEEMDNDLDGYLRAELTKQNVPLRLVLRREDDSRGERQTTADSPFLLSRALEDHGFELARLAPAKSHRLWDATQGLTHTQLAKCQSKKKGVIIGAIIGAAAGAAFGAYVVGEVGHIVGTSNGAAKYITYWSIAGSGAGALGGFAYCR